MKKKILWTAIAVILLVFAGVGIMVYKNSKPRSTANCSTTTTTITYNTDRTFSPSCIEVSPNTTVTYVNESTYTIEIGADPHPIHTGNKEVSDGEFVLTIAPGSSATTVVKTPGTMGFHDHEHSSSAGVIVVK